jgi:hypothetical protein
MAIPLECLVEPLRVYVVQPGEIGIQYDSLPADGEYERLELLAIQCFRHDFPPQPQRLRGEMEDKAHSPAPSISSSFSGFTFSYTRQSVCRSQ